MWCDVSDRVTNEQGEGGGGKNDEEGNYWWGGSPGWRIRRDLIGFLVQIMIALVGDWVDLGDKDIVGDNLN